MCPAVQGRDACLYVLVWHVSFCAGQRSCPACLHVMTCACQPPWNGSFRGCADRLCYWPVGTAPSDQDRPGRQGVPARGQAGKQGERGQAGKAGQAGRSARDDVRQSDGSQAGTRGAARAGRRIGQAGQSQARQRCGMPKCMGNGRQLDSGFHMRISGRNAACDRQGIAAL